MLTIVPCFSKGDNSMKVSKYFDESEFACKCGNHGANNSTLF
nr:MAG TPA: hypothetical protein [Caudoviricetes sp.]